MSAVNWDALLAVFEGAQGRPKEERAAFLDEHTKGDAALRREVESLLAAHESAGEFLSAPALGPLATGTSLGAFTRRLVIVERGAREVERRERNSPDQGFEQRLLPFRMLVGNRQIHCSRRHAAATTTVSGGRLASPPARIHRP